VIMILYQGGWSVSEFDFFSFFVVFFIIDVIIVFDDIIQELVVSSHVENL